jgi:hypothetical protein
MNAIQKAAFAVSALAITLVGAAFVTAPMAFARPVPVVAHHVCSTSGLQLALAGRVGCKSAGSDAGLVAFNRR